jgi:hypothetical protein
VGCDPYHLAAVPDRVELFDHVGCLLTYGSLAASFSIRGDGKFSVSGVWFPTKQHGAVWHGRTYVVRSTSCICLRFRSVTDRTAVLVRHPADTFPPVLCSTCQESP